MKSAESGTESGGCAPPPDLVHILHVIPSMNAESGGPPRVAAHLAVAQAKRGSKVSLLSTDSGEPKAIFERLGIASYPDGGDSAVQIAFGWKNGLLGQVFNNESLETEISKSSIVHVHGVWEPLLQRALIIASKLQKKTVITPHGMVSHYGMQKKKLKKAMAMALYARTGLERASLVQALTATEAKEILHYVPQANVQVIPNGIHVEEFESPPDRNAVSEAVFGLRDHSYVLYLARLDHMKGIDILIRAFALVQPRAPELHLVVAGPDYGAGQESKELTAALGLQNNVHFVGSVTGELKRALLAHAVCLTQPSRHEGFSISLLEALASGTPIVVSDRVDFPGLSERRAGRFSDLQPAAFANAILEYVYDSEARESVAARARQLVLERYTWEIVAEQLATVCAHTIRRSDRPT